MTAPFLTSSPLHRKEYDDHDPLWPSSAFRQGIKEQGMVKALLSYKKIFGIIGFAKSYIVLLSFRILDNTWFTMRLAGTYP